MFCRKCGNQITEGSKFCPKCGEPVPQVAAQIQPVATSTETQQTVTSVPADQPVTVSGKYCGKCGTDVASGVNFCPKCGNPITQANEQDATPAESIDSQQTSTYAPSPESSATSTNAPVADEATPASEVQSDEAANVEPSKTSEIQTQAPKAKRTIRLVTPTGEITLATEENVFAGEYVLEVHRNDELLGSAKIEK